MLQYAETVSMTSETPRVAREAIVGHDLVKTYGAVRAVNGLSLTVRCGEIFALLGPNGAGKTTTVEIMEGYRRPEAGSVRVLGYDPVRQGPALREHIGLMLQLYWRPDQHIAHITRHEQTSTHQINHSQGYVGIKV